MLWRCQTISWINRTKEKIVRARYRDGKLLLHKGGDRFLEIPAAKFGPEQISPTRDTRFVWMQSVIQCTHYVTGASEQDYINKADAPEVKFVRRDEISDWDKSVHGAVMKSGPLKIGIACFPLIGGSGILGGRLSGQSWRAAATKFTSSVMLNPVRLDLPQDNLHFH